MQATYTEQMFHFTGGDGAKYRLRPADPDTDEQGWVIDLKGTFYSYCGNAVQWLPFGQRPTYDEALDTLTRVDTDHGVVYTSPNEEKESP